MTFKPLFKRAVDGKRINEWNIEVEGNKYRTISGFHGMVQTTSEWTICDSKSYCTAEEQALKEATALHRKRKEKGYFEDINQCDTKVFFEPMLAQDWDKHKTKVTFPLFSQPKLDGIRCIVRADGMWSRNGKPIISAPHIYHSVRHLFDSDPDLILDGELYADKFATDFNKICSLVKKTKPTLVDLLESKSNIEYHVYDVPSHDGVFSDRFLYLNQLDHQSPFLRIVETNFIFKEDDILFYYEDYVERGYEGQMIRLDAPYEQKRSKHLLKHKSFVDEEFEIVGYLEGEGNRTGMIGKFILKHDKYPNETFDSNIKANWDELKEIWANRDSYIGKLATVKYFNRTPRNEAMKKGDVPRFPYVIKIDRNSYE